ncbi:MAG TPA: hypothetical protein VGD43_03355 [Micromonospora sp.]
MTDSERRRRRLRHGVADDVERVGSGGNRSAATPEVHDPVVEQPRRGPGGPGDDRDERGLRGLVGPGASQVGVSAALRARDASQPTVAELAEAEQRLVLVRRNWTPREELPRNSR